MTTGDDPPPRIATDSLGGEIVELRQLHEGVSTFRFSATGARLTGNAPARAGVLAVILGDSYVLAAEVNDGRTMGGQLETRARAKGIPLDVRQYGWRNASPAQYLYVANDVSRRWRPRRVFVVLSDNDMDGRSQAPSGAHLRVDPSGAARVVGAPLDTVASGGWHSVLFSLARFRWHVLTLRMTRQWLHRNASARRAEATEIPPDSAEYAAMPRAIVDALADAYGPSLTMIFVAAPGVRGDSTPWKSEQRFLAACAARGADCVSTRRAMLDLRRAGRVAHGGPTFSIGNGHLNDAGHRVMADLMLERLR